MDCAVDLELYEYTQIDRKRREKGGDACRISTASTATSDARASTSSNEKNENNTPRGGEGSARTASGGRHVSSSVIAEYVVYQSGMVANPAARGQIEQRGKRVGVLSSRNRKCRRNGVETVLLVDAEQDQQREDECSDVHSKHR